jgi:hypothetical protein
LRFHVGRLVPPQRDGCVPLRADDCAGQGLLRSRNGGCQTPPLHQVKLPSLHAFAASGTSRCSHLFCVFQVQSPDSATVATTAVVRPAREDATARHLLMQPQQHPDWFGKLSTNDDNDLSP